MVSGVSLSGLKYEIRLLSAIEMDAFHRFAADSTLRSLSDPQNCRDLLKRGLVIVAICEGNVIGCSCLQIDAHRNYIGLTGETCVLPLSSIYLCSTFVQPEHR